MKQINDRTQCWSSLSKIKGWFGFVFGNLKSTFRSSFKKVQNYVSRKNLKLIDEIFEKRLIPNWTGKSIALLCYVKVDCR